MDMFADEAREHLQALNQALLGFEKQPENPELVNVMFRSAHTLKGMSATMGFSEVAELTHKMEDLLTPIRQGQLKTSGAIVDLLFKCLDALQEMVEAHIGGSEHAVEIDGLVSELVRLAAGGATAPAAAAPASPAPAAVQPQAHAPVATNGYPGELSADDVRAAQAAQAGGAQLIHVHVTLRGDCELRNVRAFMVLRELKQLGGLIHSTPDEQSLKEKDFGRSFDVLLASSQDALAVRSAATSVLEVDSASAAVLGTVAAGEPAPAVVIAPDAASVFGFNEYDLQLIRSALADGYRVIHAHVQLEEDCTLKSARAFMVHKRLEEFGEIISVHPDVEDIEFERFDRDLDFLLLTKAAEGATAQGLASISEISSICVNEKPAIPLRAINRLDAQQAVVEAIAAAESPRAAATSAVKSKRGTVESPQAGAAIVPAGAGALKPEAGPARQVEKVRQSQTIRVDTERLDTLLNLVGELVIGKTRLTSISRSVRDSELSSAIEQVGHIISDLQGLVMQTRMVPIETVFNRFPRMIRDLAKSRGKQVELVLQGGETELDRTVIDEIGDPLVHLIRNAVDHGIEPPDVREQAGKPRTGTLTLAAYHEGSNVFLQIRDDGAGIDAERIRRKAVDKGLVSAEQAAALSFEHALELIFLPGLSTVEQVTDVSGRGVGMDVVRTKVHELSGEVKLATELGVGSTFTVKLPLTLAIVQALLVKVAAEEFAIPLAYIEETLRLRPAQIQKISQQDVVLLRGDILPLVWLRKLLQSPEAERPRGAGDKDGSAGKRDGWFAVVVRSGGQRVGLCVDETIGLTEIVIKSLGRYLLNTKYIAGGTILGDGTVALILDVAHIVG